MGGLAYVERFIEHLIRRRFEGGNERARDVFNVYNRPPWRTVGFQVDLSGRKRPGHQIVQHDVETLKRQQWRSIPWPGSSGARMTASGAARWPAGRKGNRRVEAVYANGR